MASWLYAILLFSWIVPLIIGYQNIAIGVFIMDVFLLLFGNTVPPQVTLFTYILNILVVGYSVLYKFFKE